MNFHKMMRKAGSVLSLAAATSLVVAGTVAAQSLPANLSNGWWSAQTLVNTGTADATVSATAYELSGGSDGEEDVANLATLLQGQSVTILPEVIAGNGPKVAGISTGSMVISSDQPLVAVVALTNEKTASLGSDGGRSAGTYEGTGNANTSTTLSFPVAKQNYFDRKTVFFVQNAGASAADITATFAFNGTTADVPFTAVGANRSVAIVPPAAMPAGTLGSLTVTSANPLAGAVLELENAAPVSVNHKAGRALTSSDEATTLLVPSFKKNYGANDTSSAIGVQGAAKLEGNIVYTCSDADAGQGGCTPGQQFTVDFETPGPGASYSAWPFATDGHEVLPNNSLYSAVVNITSGGNGVADVGETGSAAPAPLALESQYVGLPSTQAGKSWLCPSHKEKYFKNGSGIVVLPTAYPAEISAEFTVSDTETDAGDSTYNGQTFTANPTTIQAGSLVYYDVANAIAPGDITWNGAAMPTSPGLLTSVKITSNQDVIVISNEEAHFSFPDVQVDGRQYGCFALSN